MSCFTRTKVETVAHSKVRSLLCSKPFHYPSLLSISLSCFSTHASSRKLLPSIIATLALILFHVSTTRACLGSIICWKPQSGSSGNTHLVLAEISHNHNIVCGSALSVPDWGGIWRTERGLPWSIVPVTLDSSQTDTQRDITCLNGWTGSVGIVNVTAPGAQPQAGRDEYAVARTEQKLQQGTTEYNDVAVPPVLTRKFEGIQMVCGKVSKVRTRDGRSDCTDEVMGGMGFLRIYEPPATVTRTVEVPYETLGVVIV